MVVPQGAVPLSAAIGALRTELMLAVWAGQFPYQVDGQQRWLRFKSSAVEVTLQVAVTSTGSARAGVKWWLIEAAGRGRGLERFAVPPGEQSELVGIVASTKGDIVCVPAVQPGGLSAR